MNLKPFLRMRRKNLGEHVLHLFPLHDPVNKSMIQKELRTLESLREFLSYGLLNNPGTGKSDECLGLRPG